MKLYIRKVFPHDITHEVGVRSDVVSNFFKGKSKDIIFVGKQTKKEYVISINNKTDPRFGGDFKKMLVEEGNVNVNDLLFIYKNTDNKYEIEIVKPDDERYFSYMVIFRGRERHALVESF